MAGIIEDNAITYSKQTNKYLQPPGEQFNCNIFAMDFADRKFIKIGLDPVNVFNVVICIITSTRYVRISMDLLRRIYSMMEYILSIIKPVKRERDYFSKRKWPLHQKWHITVTICS